ncbi:MULTISPECIES: AraC family transcriptional regulator [Chryseobacterium]|uniref:AraC family transcriptional regulator n=3 Tax=Chryseobacterium TaxID=59732 RepID=A0A3D9B4Z3_9FLAO|nr:MULTISPECIES: AraC family transcriptional regulator [Chryseobacterium]MDO3426587.1 AraC family transcriptional regulator [Chryseobacterium sp. APV1]OVE57815.1 AraC family transcriptional regulator [Chryseobacterium mucoviscidosis]REC48695.1 AraC family transcriptional regulator [Candidatus Chryseobacterium massiliae]HCR77869.1 AraC family transcriptional regulator [Chryseobacterium sp.]
MKMYVKFDFNTLCKKILDEKLREHGLKYRLLNFGEVEFYESLTQEQHKNFKKNLEDYGIEIIENQKAALVQKIKDAIVELISSEEGISVKASIYIAEKLNHSYGYLSNLFSEITHTSIENFLIIRKIEFAKELIISKKLSFTEIAYRLNYSSVAHLSTQFKNTTGMTPSQFQKIISLRRKLSHINEQYLKAV